ncbi:hypothetical protein B0H21DRAFT_819183 [Amylocystis lapponica]|nr:hypothetical protein B0H21DRAFT_819183 [Amylocystis lapponica]
MTTPLPKAALYYYPKSVWASVPLLALEEKGYGPDELDLKTVDLAKGDNFSPSYLRLNPNATVPTLVVPLHKTLGPDMESRYKALQDTKARSIVEFLDKSRSTQSRTHTTSSAPSPSLSPATIAFNATLNKVVDLLHSPAGDPNVLTYLNARDDSALQTLAAARLPMLTARRDALVQLLADNETAKIRVSEKTKAFWEAKRVATEGFLQVYADAGTAELSEDARKKRQEFFTSANAAWTALKDVLTQINQEIIGPYVLGDQLSIADLHLAAWLARLATLSGGSAAEDGLLGGRGAAAAGVLSTGPESTDRQNRLAAFWDAAKERASFKKVYGDGLH